MKAVKFFKYILVAALALAFAACQEEPYAPGDPDLLDCHGLFFPQEQARDYEVSPDGNNYLTFTVERTLTAFEAEVPYTLTSSEDGFFELEDEFLYFEEDQDKLTFKVYFSDDYEVGQKYTCSIKVTDPQYVSQYGLSSNELSFSLTVVQWDLIGEGTWRDDFFSSLAQVFGASLAQPYLETSVKVYERADKKNAFRVDGIYTPEYVSQMFAGDDSYVEALKDYCPAPSIYINATNPDKVYIDAQLAFYSPFGNQYSGYPVLICSDVEEVFPDGYSNLYGTLQEGVISFPANSLVLYLYNAGTAYANLAGKTRLVLPGYRGFDYSLSVVAHPSEEGVMPVEFIFGEDVAEVRYKVFEGHLSDVDMVSKLDEVKSGKGVETISEAGTYDFTSSKTGLYTLIACAYDKDGELKTTATTKFGYDTVDDPKDVDIHLGLVVSDKYGGAGMTAENSVEYYVYGTDITEAKVGVYKKSHYDDFRAAIDAEFEYYVPELDRNSLASLNGIGFSGVIGGLTPGTEYILIVYAGNGYHSGVYTATATTDGVFDLMDAEFSVYDLPDRLQPATHDDYLKSWEVWSLDPYTARSWGRSERGAATFSDKEDVMFDVEGNITDKESEADYIMDYLSLSGMHADAAEKYGFSNDIDFEYYNGFIYTMMTQMPETELKADHVDDGKTVAKAGTIVYPTNAYLFFTGDGFSPNLENGAMIGGFVTEEKDVIAFVGNPSTYVGSYGYSYVAMQLCYFLKEDYSGDGYLVSESCHAYPLLVSPDSQYAAGSETASLQAPAACRQVAFQLQQGRTNYVESARGYILSTIDRISKAPHNYLENASDVGIELREETPVYTMTKSSSTAPASAKIELVERALR